MILFASHTLPKAPLPISLITSWSAICGNISLAALLAGSARGCIAFMDSFRVRGETERVTYVCHLPSGQATQQVCDEIVILPPYGAHPTHREGVFSWLCLMNFVPNVLFPF